MHITKQHIQETHRIKRLNLVNSITGIKPANLIGTISGHCLTNLAIISSVTHIGSNPALLGFISRPFGNVRRHTYENIMETKVFTINQVHSSITTKAHYTSAKFEKGISEFEECNLTEEYIPGFKPPFVKESHIKIGLTWRETIPIKINDTALIIGEIEHLIIPGEAMNDSGHIDLELIQGIGISGLNNYYRLNNMIHLPYARVNELPDFKG